MNAVEIEEAVSALAEAPFDPEEFPFQFLQAFGESLRCAAEHRLPEKPRPNLGVGRPKICKSIGFEDLLERPGLGGVGGLGVEAFPLSVSFRREEQPPWEKASPRNRKRE